MHELGFLFRLDEDATPAASSGAIVINACYSWSCGS
jgi:hypothetical protein